MDYPLYINQIISNRHSVYPVSFTGETIDDKIIHQLLENANCAPSHKKTYPWRFIVYSDKARIKLSNYSSEWYRNNTPVENFSEHKYLRTKNKALKSSHVIAIIMHRHKELLPEWEAVAAVSCAVQNMWLSCSAYGLGAYWSSPNFAVKGDEFFELTPDQRCLGLFYIGKKIEGLNEKKRESLIGENIKWLKA